MAFYPKKKQSDFIPAPEGLHRSVCCDLVDLGVVKVSWQGQESHKDMLSIVWQTEERMPNGKPFLISRRYTNSTHAKSTLRIHCESWRGKKFTDEEFAAFDLERLIGANCQIQVTHNISGGETYANIQAIVPAAKNMPALTVQDYTRKKDRPGYKAPAHMDDPAEGHGDFPESQAETRMDVDDDIPF